MTEARAIETLTSAIQDELNASQSQIAKHWLLLAIQEMKAAQICMGAGKRAEAEKHLDTASEFYTDGVRKRAMVIDFISGPDGSIRKASE
jgi:hypothetical protein